MIMFVKNFQECVEDALPELTGVISVFTRIESLEKKLFLMNDRSYYYGDVAMKDAENGITVSVIEEKISRLMPVLFYRMRDLNQAYHAKTGKFIFRKFDTCYSNFVQLYKELDRVI